MTDNVTPFPTAKPVQILATAKDPNADILERMKGVEAFSVQPLLRWNAGTLEQAWKGTSSGIIQWRRVQDASEMTLPVQTAPQGAPQ